MIVVATILFAAVLCWDLITDYGKWLTERKVLHPKEWWVRVALLLPSIILYGWPRLLSMAAAALMVAVYFWLLFDGLYNAIRGYNWWYTGTDDADDAKTDDLLQRLTLSQHILLKLGGCVAAIIIYLKL
jgi:hypothetical protein